MHSLCFTYTSKLATIWHDKIHYISVTYKKLWKCCRVFWNIFLIYFGTIFGNFIQKQTKSISRHWKWAKISVCKHKHAFIGENVCPKCGEPNTDTYARVVGFYTPTSSYQKIRKKEFDKRRWLNVLSNEGVMRWVLN